MRYPLGADSGLKVFLVFAALLFLVSPFLVSTLFLAAMAVLSSMGRSSNCQIRINWLAFGVAVLVSSWFIGSKSLAPSLGNDRAMYLDYVYLFRGGGFYQLMSYHPEWVSFGALWLISMLVDGKGIFWLFYIVVMAAVGLAFRGNVRFLPLFFLLLMSSSVFLNLYGNLVRQSLASAFVLGALTASKKRVAGIVVLGVFSHLSVFLAAPAMLLSRKINFNFFTSVLLVFIGFSCSSLLGYMVDFLASSGSVLASKVSFYQDFESSDSDQSGLTFGLMLTILFLVKLIKDRTNIIGRGDADMFERLFSFLVLMSFVLALMTGMGKVFERVFVYYYVVFVFFAVFCVYGIASERVRIVAVASLVFILCFSVIIRLGGGGYYPGAQYEYAQSNFLSMFVEWLGWM